PPVSLLGIVLRQYTILAFLLFAALGSLSGKRTPSASKAASFPRTPSSGVMLSSRGSGDSRSDRADGDRLRYGTRRQDVQRDVGPDGLVPRGVRERCAVERSTSRSLRSSCGAFRDRVETVHYRPRGPFGEQVTRERERRTAMHCGVMVTGYNQGDW